MINIKTNTTSKMLPVYTMYIVGYPCQEVFFFERAAEQLNIYLKVEYHGCVIDFSDDENEEKSNIIKINREKYEALNVIAKQYYVETHGLNWLDQVKELAKHLALSEEYNKFMKKKWKEINSKIIVTMFLNIFLFVSLFFIFNIYIGLIACLIFTIYRYFRYIKNNKRDNKYLKDLKFRINNNVNSHSAPCPPSPKP